MASFARHKGISYIMSVLMMTLVISAMSSVVLFWGLDTVGESRVSLSGAVRARMDRARERIIIEDIQMVSTSTLRVYVRNFGDIQAVVDQVYVNHTQTPITRACPSGTSPPAPPALCPNVSNRISLPIQSSGAVDIDLSAVGLSAASQRTSLIRAATTRGTIFTGQFTV